jgi:hypothetical protein
LVMGEDGGAAASAAATDFTWSGADTTTPSPNWSDGANWLGEVAPAGASTIGTLSFPTLSTADCTSTTPVGTCYQSNNDRSGITVGNLEVAADDYVIGGNGITLDGGVSTTSGGSFDIGPELNLPIALGADQTWNLAANTMVQLGSALSGDHALTVDGPGGLEFQGDNEVGAVSITGGAQVLLKGDLDSGSGNPVNLTGSSLNVYGTRWSVGALSVDGSSTLDLEGPGGSGPHSSSLSVASATFDPGSTILMPAGAELTSTGSIDLGSAQLQFTVGDNNNPCNAGAIGGVVTLVSTTGSLNGTFSNAQQGAVLSTGCDQWRIGYDTTGSTKTVTATLLGTPTTTVLGASPDPTVTNETVTLVAITTSAGLPGDLAGSTVAFTDNGNPIPGCGAQGVVLTGQLGNTVYSASCQTSFAAASSQAQLSAVLTPTTQFADQPSTGTNDLTIRQDTTTTALAASSTTPTVGADVTYTATVDPGHSGSTLPTGSVEFLDGKTPIGSCASQPLTTRGASSVASCKVSYSSAGGQSIAAEYLADANFTGSTSPALTVTVKRTKPPPRTTVVAQFNLSPPRAGSKALGVAQIIKHGTAYSLAIVARNLKANSPRNAYAVWLYNSPRKAKLLGFVNPGVRRNGRLQTAGPLPSDATRYRELIVTLETKSAPRRPGPIELQGRLHF